MASGSGHRICNFEGKTFDQLTLMKWYLFGAEFDNDSYF